mgnify:CR=1 FL=1
MFEVVLFEPEIPPNTGNVIRLCAVAGARLHLIEPLGFALDDARLRRAGLDYHEYAELRVHRTLAAWEQACGDARLFAFSTRGAVRHDAIAWRPGDALLFGPETRGLPDTVLAALPAERRVRLPQRPGLRSLNLSNAVAIAVYEGWRQLDFAGARDLPES